MTPRRVEAAGAMPGGWVLQGTPLAVPDSAGGIWGVIHRVLQADPGAACLRCGGATFTRGQVLAAVERIAWQPHHRRVGLHVPRSSASVVLTLAIWRNGGAYVPIASDYPPAVVTSIAENCGLDLVIADRRLDLPDHPLVTVDHSSGAPAFFHARAQVTPSRPGDDRLCYVAHTSGSTGAPKAVMLSHANLLNRLACMQSLLAVEAQDRMLYKTSAVFDVHVWEFTLALASGCLLVITPQAKHFDLLEVARIIVAEGVTVVGFVPTLLRMLLGLPAFVAGNRLRAVFCGGEGWGPGLARDFHAQLPGRALYNSYGPAETTLAVANWPAPDHPGLNQICIGDPMPNLVFLIEEAPGDSGAKDCAPEDCASEDCASEDCASEDCASEDCASEDCASEDCGPGSYGPEGCGQHVGPLCIGGAQVALGYVGDRGRERFFERVICGQAVRFYRTGDLVKLDLATGSLQFKGREDSQVKVNGMRIELDAIEEAVCAVLGVQGCVAFVAKTGGSPQLCAAYQTAADRPVREVEVRRGCAHRLPALHIPTRLQQVTAFPLAASGKIDRAAVIARFGSAEAAAP